MARQTLLFPPGSTTTNQRPVNRASSGPASFAIRSLLARGLISRSLERSASATSPNALRTRTVATPSPPSSADEWDSSSSGSDSDSDSDSESHAEEYILPQDHRFQPHRPDLLQLAQVRLKEFSSCVQYYAPPQKWLRTARWQAEPFYPEEYEDPSDPELVVLAPKPKMTKHFHLACPFHVSDPVKYKQCLILYNEQSIEALIDHITRHHAKPLYCARCSEIFDTAVTRDNHILDGKCELLEQKAMDGIDPFQKSRLWKRDRWYFDERKRWRKIWTTCFPKQPPQSPYLGQGLGLEVSMARDFWEVHGWRCVKDFLDSRGCLDERNDENDRALEALCDLVLEDLLAGLVGGPSS